MFCFPMFGFPRFPILFVKFKGHFTYSNIETVLYHILKLNKDRRDAVFISSSSPVFPPYFMQLILHYHKTELLLS